MGEVVDVQAGVDGYGHANHGADRTVVQAEVGLQYEGMHPGIIQHITQVSRSCVAR